MSCNSLVMSNFKYLHLKALKLSFTKYKLEEGVHWNAEKETHIDVSTESILKSEYKSMTHQVFVRYQCWTPNNAWPSNQVFDSVSW